MMAPQAKSTMVCQMFREAPLAPTEETLILGDLALPTINLPNKPKFCTRCYMRWNLTRLCSFFLSVQCGRDPSGLHHKVMLEPVQWLSCKKTHVPILRASSRFPWLKHHFHPFPHYLCACDHFDDSKRVHLSEMKPSWPRFHSSKSLRCLRKHCLFSWSL